MTKQSDSGYYIGIDAGTGGVRVIICDETGNIYGQSQSAFQSRQNRLPAGWHEQDPREWWESLKIALPEALSSFYSSLPPKNPEELRSISVTSTSGTIIPLDSKYTPLSQAIMYNDQRADKEAKDINGIAGELTSKLGYTFNSSFALAKILWLKNNRPEIFDGAALFVHAADFIIGKLCGNFGLTDHTNALKTGFDLISYTWPGFIEEKLAVPIRKLPGVRPPGKVAGKVSNAAAGETNLPEGLPVLLGMTDGCAAQVASGAVRPGNWSTTLGTTMVIKGVTRELLKDPLGRVYSHLHPEGCWMPGGASNTGGAILEKEFGRAQLTGLNERVVSLLPTNLISYPLTGRGERFPFRNPEACGFTIGGHENEVELFGACLEGVGYLERLSYEMLGELGAEVGDQIYTCGGGTRSNPWLRVRASILKKRLLKPKVSESAFGAAVIAASVRHGGLTGSAEKMVHISEEVEPEKEWVRIYEERYGVFKAELKKRGYIG